MSAASTKDATTTTTTAVPTWEELQAQSEATPVGKALNQEVALRTKGEGSAHVQSNLRTFNRGKDAAKITLFRDYAGWCPYCQKTMLLVEEKEIPMKIELVPMRSYGDKPREFLQKVPSGLLPAIQLENGKVITESQIIMELLDEWHTAEDGYKEMVPKDAAGFQRYQQLARLERELFSWWCTVTFRPEGGIVGGLLNNPFSSKSANKPPMSGALRSFLECMEKVDAELTKTPGPWFFEKDHPTMMDFIYISHVERMLASLAFWKGLDLRNVSKWGLKGLNTWLEAFEQRESYLAFKSDYFTHVMDIPPQYGPGYSGGFDEDRDRFVGMILGRDGSSWTLPLSFDDPLQPLYKGPPLPLCVLESMGLTPSAEESDGNTNSYEHCDPTTMEHACRLMAAWKLAGNGPNVAQFAARGGPKGAQNMRKTFAAPLADPYAEADQDVQPFVDTALRLVCLALSQVDDTTTTTTNLQEQLVSVIPAANVVGVCSSLAYVRDRVGVPRDLPLASARYLRAYLNWAIDTLQKE